MRKWKHQKHRTSVRLSVVILTERSPLTKSITANKKNLLIFYFVEALALSPIGYARKPTMGGDSSPWETEPGNHPQFPPAVGDATERPSPQNRKKPTKEKKQGRAKPLQIAYCSIFGQPE